MRDAGNFSKNIDFFRKKMERRDEFMTMHLPRSFANKAEELFGPLLFPNKRAEDAESEQQSDVISI